MFKYSPLQGTCTFFNLQVLLHTVAARLQVTALAHAGKLLPAQVVIESFKACQAEDLEEKKHTALCKKYLN